MIRKIVSGGQTGADQGALDAALESGIDHGGWIIRGRKTEAGPLPEKYMLEELQSEIYAERTRRNVIDSDGTLIVVHGQLTGGTALTGEYAEQMGKPCLVMDLGSTSLQEAALTIAQWLENENIAILNVAGPRASKNPAIHDAVRKLLKMIIKLS